MPMSTEQLAFALATHRIKQDGLQGQADCYGVQHDRLRRQYMQWPYALLQAEYAAVIEQSARCPHCQAAEQTTRGE